MKLIQKLRVMAAVTLMFKFQEGERVIWTPPVTKSAFAIFQGVNVGLDGNQYATLQVLPGASNESPYKIECPADQICPAF